MDQLEADDERKGIDWFNALTEQERGEWLRLASSAVPADAWAAYKRQQANRPNLH